MITVWRESPMNSEARGVFLSVSALIALVGTSAVLDSLFSALGFSNPLRDSMLLSLALFVTTWTIIWRRQMLQSRRSLAGILVVAVVSAGGGLVAWYATEDSWLHLGCVYGGSFAVSVWIAGTALVWRRPPLEIESGAAGARLVIRCPKCGYDLRGVRELRCSECGTEFQFDDLVRRVLRELTGRALGSR